MINLSQGVPRNMCNNFRHCRDWRARGILAAALLCAAGCSDKVAGLHDRMPTGEGASSAELAAAAISSQDEAVQRSATQTLAERAPRLRELMNGTVTAADRNTLEQMRRVFVESRNSQVRVTMAQELGSRRDWKSLPALVDAMESDEVPEVQKNATQAAVQITGMDFMFRLDAPLEERQRAIERYREQIRTIEAEPLLSEFYHDRAKMQEFKQLRAEQFHQELDGETGE
jgi:hypothetical protein